MERILIVEDNQELREALIETLQVMGYEVHAAASGREGISLARQLNGPIDLLISDLVTPGMNALELHDAMQQLAYNGKMLIITAYPMPHAGASLLSRPNVTWAHKPIGLHELQLILAQLTATRPS